MTRSQGSRRQFARIASTLAIVMTALTYAFAMPADEARRVVFEVTVDGTEQWEAVVNNVENARRTLGHARTEVRVIAHGKGIGLLRKTNTALAERIASLAASGVQLAACENTMKRLTLTKADLLAAVGTSTRGWPRSSGCSRKAGPISRPAARTRRRRPTRLHCPDRNSEQHCWR
jgi:uncharacterized protein